MKSENQNPIAYSIPITDLCHSFSIPSPQHNWASDIEIILCVYSGCFRNHCMAASISSNKIESKKKKNR